jgi:hypothetical protein
MALTVVNLILTSVICILGIWAFFKRRSDLALAKRVNSQESVLAKATAIPSVSLFIGIAFGLFAISHALTLAGLDSKLESFIIVIRVIGYLLIVIAPARILLKK